jgi:hypothetical protein
MPLALAGNIIPAIATTNAVIAGLIVMESLKVLRGKLNECRMVQDKYSFYLNYDRRTLTELYHEADC